MKDWRRFTALAECFIAVMSSIEPPVGRARTSKAGQRTGGNGMATFVTIRPGWYTCRTVHVAASDGVVMAIPEVGQT